MATYKKRGYKKPTKKEGDLLENEVYEGESTTEEVFNTLNESASKTEEWVASNQKFILGGIGVVVLLVLGFLGYQQFILKPKELSIFLVSFEEIGIPITFLNLL